MENTLKRNLKVLMVAPAFKPLVGGYERAAERLSEALARRGHEVLVVTERRSSKWPGRERHAGFQILRLRCIYRKGWHAVTALFSFAWFLIFHGWRYNVFHVHVYGYYVLVSLIFGKIMRKPLVLKLTSTGAYGIGHTISSPTIRFNRMLTAAHRKINACIAPSKTAMQEAIELGIPSDRVYLVPNGVDVEFFSPCSANEKLKLRQVKAITAECVVLYVGRLSTEKNPLGLLRAWQMIHANSVSAELVYVGTGPQLDELKTQAMSLGCSGSVRLIGDSEDVRSWYRVADVFVLPSDHEGLSNSLIEAMACGLPVISTRVSGSKEIFSEADIGELVEVGDVKGLSRSLTKLLTEPERRIACGAIARQYAIQKFSLDVVTESVVKIYKGLIA